MSVAEDVRVKKAVKDRGAESPRARFLRLAVPRVRNAVKKMHLVGNLGMAGYESTPTEREKIVSEIFNAVHEAKRRLEGKSRKDDFVL